MAKTAAPKARPIGVYVHFPWCRRRCAYCDFAIAVAPRGEIPARAYTDAVLRELELRAPEVSGGQLATLYFGGGTPALWEPALLQEVVGAVGQILPGVSEETTLECNPADVTDARLSAWWSVGISRLSIGLQSLVASDLVTIGRPALMGYDLAPIRLAMEAGFEVSADVIIGIPGAVEPLTTAEALAHLRVPHVSVYELTVEPRTPLAAAAARGDVVLPEEEFLEEVYSSVHALMTAAGYEHYEVSSYALPGHRARHNQRYWVGGECLGLGNSATSLLRRGAGAVRRTNTRSAGVYLGGGGDAAGEIEELSATDLDAERRWLGLRTLEGAPAALFRQLPGAVESLVRDGLAERVGSRIIPTLKGFLCGDEVARRVLGP